ncbi:signal peptidase II [Anaplasmataceae bacterium AB001_6]|nr:signal peptidase II [Anaplasmataceae bacterium AB001_6]
MSKYIAKMKQIPHIKSLKISSFLYISLIISAVIFIDQISKLFITEHFQISESKTITNNFAITLALNKGISFGMLSEVKNASQYILGITAICLSGIILIILREERMVIKYALSVTLGGAISNLIDRIRIGEVIDFIDLHYDKFHYPVFNIADICITLSIIFVTIRSCK